MLTHEPQKTEVVQYVLLRWSEMDVEWMETSRGHFVVGDEHPSGVVLTEELARQAAEKLAKSVTTTSQTFRVARKVTTVTPKCPATYTAHYPGEYNTKTTLCLDDDDHGGYHHDADGRSWAEGNQHALIGQDGFEIDPEELKAEMHKVLDQIEEMD
jgi:hypothetical protein